MEFNWIWIIGPVVATFAMLSVGRNMVRKDKGKEASPLPPIILVTVAILFHLFWGESSLLDRISRLLLDFGIAMILDIGYLAHHKSHYKVFWGLGMLSLVLAGMVYGASMFFGFLVDGWKNGFIEKERTELFEGKTEVLVELGPDDRIQELAPILEKFGVRGEKAFPTVDLSEDEDLSQVYLIEIDQSKLKGFLSALKKDKENVDYAIENYRQQLVAPMESKQKGVEKTSSSFANDPRINQQWWFDPIESNQLFELLKNNKPKRKAKIAIVDTGVDSKHEDLQAVFSDSPGGTDKMGHGTHCAGLAGAATNNRLGIGSLNWEGEFIEIYGFQALNEQGFGTLESVTQAVVDAAEAGVDVLSMSLGGPNPIPPRLYVEAIEYAIKKGAIVVVSAGNSNRDAKDFSPANVPGVIVVSAIDQNMKKATFSNTNTSLKMPIAAPGVSIHSTIPGNQYKDFNGTSMAAPLVSGLVGILKAYDPNLDTESAYDIIHQTGKKLEESNQIGRAIHPLKAIQSILK